MDQESKIYYPLSYTQRRLWFLDQFDPGNIAYNLSSLYEINGELDQELLAKCLSEVFYRHEILRTVFEGRPEGPRQCVVVNPELPLKLLDFSDRNEKELQSAIREQTLSATREPYSLINGPLARFTLIKTGVDKHVLHIAMHHIITDGWSSRLLIKEITDLYTAFREGNPSPLKPLPIQYGNFAELQRVWLQEDNLAEQLEYWKGKLQGSRPIELPRDHPRPARQTFEGSSIDWSFSENLARKLKALATEQRATLFMVLLAALNILVARLSQNKDVVVGIPIANRTRSELESLIGFFVNTLALRTDLSDDPSFKELLARIREETLQAYVHQDLPFERLVEELHQERDLSRNPVYQIFFAFQNLPVFSQEIAGLTIKRLSQKRTSVMTDLDIYLLERSGALQGTFVFNTALFETETIERFIRHYEVVLEQIVEAPECAVSEIPILSNEQQDQIQVDWNATEVDHPGEKTLISLFEKQVERTPNQIALQFADEKITFSQLNASANQFAHHLSNLGVALEDPVGVCLDRSIDQVTAILGVLKAGGMYVPLDPDYPKDRINYMLHDSNARVLITHSRLSGLYSEYENAVINVDLDQAALDRQPDTDPHSVTRPESAAYIIYTSGSTGLPKGVVGLHRGAVNRCNWMWKNYPFKQDEVCCLKTRISFVDSVWELFGPLLQGVKVVLIPDEVVQDSARLVDSLSFQRISRLVLVPSLLGAIVENERDLRKRLPHLDLWITSGEALSDELYKKFRVSLPDCRLLNLYGSSEVSADVTSCELTLDESRNRVTIGRPIDNTKVFILDQHKNPMPVGVPGEIYVGGAGLARGYFKREDLTAERFFRIQLANGQKVGVFRTGDLGRFLVNGEIEYLGRADSQIKLRGFRVELGEIEAVLEETDGIDTAIVILKETPFPRLIAFYTLQADHTAAINEDLLNERVRAKLPRYMVPAIYQKLDAIPLSPSGKFDRLALNNLASERKEGLKQERNIPETDIEVRLLDIWRDTLHITEIGTTDNFFDLGGHSLLAIELMAKVNGAFGKSLAVVTLFETPTIKEQARSIATEDSALSRQSLIRVKGGSDQKEPLILVHDVDGEAILYYGLSQSVHKDRPVYVLRPSSSADSTILHTRVEDMAAHYIQEIKQLFPEGPYIVGGLCAGGVIGFEIACQLQAMGDRVSMVAIIDALETTTRPVRKKWSSRLRDFRTVFDREVNQETGNSSAQVAQAMIGTAFHKIKSVISYELRTKGLNLYNRFRVNLFEKYMKSQRPLPGFLKNIPMATIYSSARRKYSPGQFSGQLTLFRATEAKQEDLLPFDDTPVRKITDDPTFGWSKRATQGVHAEDVPGGHSTMLQDPNVVVLGQKLEKLLEDT